MSIAKVSYSVDEWHVPPPPALPAPCMDVLRWLIIVIDPEDGRLATVASLFLHGFRIGLSTKQADLAGKIFDQIHKLYRGGQLVCQKDERDT